MKATFTLPNGTVVNIEGSPDETHKLLSLYEPILKETGGKTKPYSTTPQMKPKKKTHPERTTDYLTQIVNLIKSCDEADKIEENIIDRISQVDRVLLPLYIVHEYMDNSIWLQSGEISKITRELGILVLQPNVSSKLSGTAARYVMGDRVKKAKQVVKYKLNRRGVKYLKGVIEGKQND